MQEISVVNSGHIDLLLHHYTGAVAGSQAPEPLHEVSANISLLTSQSNNYKEKQNYYKETQKYYK